jgi:hypothetical protein
LQLQELFTETDRVGRPRTVQPGNQEWVTMIECINTVGSVIPPLVIFEAAMHQAAWYKDNIIQHNWSTGVSEFGWTINEIGLTWLHIFYERIKDRTVGMHRLFVLDGYRSHGYPKFDQFSLDHQVVVVCMPKHSSHLLQPLDVGCSSALKQAYGCHVEQLMRHGVNRIDKREFLPL